ncbi:DUF1853 family protein [uncultured Psychroserpens sp.]|uniref:DUF1853 family protein n=1 Tax=uncultured Psychroserpens sp. TaxID=255436 RepID=UPI0026346AF3|nr:DUF1853 family protein [uncultured Psychroserpens sp.]
MHIEPKHLQNLYQSYCKTPLLWKNNLVSELVQFDIPITTSFPFLRTLERQLRLGQLAEQFVFNQLETDPTITLLAENIQIQKGSQTLGELDVLIRKDKQPIHLEIVYKFYVYDDTLGRTEIDCWIGPNRKDSLIEKLDKLKQKQLPLLYSSECSSTLSQLKLDHLNFEQQVLFKAQLFVPYNKSVNFENLNKECVYGFYIHHYELELFQNCVFYIPPKLDWFLDPSDTIEWLDYKRFKDSASTYLNSQQSPLFWLKNDSQDLSKCFLLWW